MTKEGILHILPSVGIFAVSPHSFRFYRNTARKSQLARNTLVLRRSVFNCAFSDGRNDIAIEADKQIDRDQHGNDLVIGEGEPYERIVASLLSDAR